MKTILLMLLLTTCATAQTITPAPKDKDHHFFDFKNVALITLSATTIAGDGITTGRIMERNKPVFNPNLPVGDVLGRDMNPLVGMFAKSTAGNAAYFASAFAAEVGGMAFLHRHGHHRLERILPLAVSAVETYWVMHNHNLIQRYDHYSR